VWFKRLVFWVSPLTGGGYEAVKKLPVQPERDDGSTIASFISTDSYSHRGR